MGDWLGTVFVAKSIGLVVPLESGRLQRVTNLVGVVGAEEEFARLKSNSNVRLRATRVAAVGCVEFVNDRCRCFL